MTGEPVGYLLVCDHPEHRVDVADIDDHRAHGGTVEAGLWYHPHGGYGATAAPRNRRGSHRQLLFACPLCDLNVQIDETSLPELVDKIAAGRHMLPTATGRYLVALRVVCAIVGQLRARGRKHAP